MRRLLVVGVLFLNGCQANPPLPVEATRFDETLTEVWRVEPPGGLLPGGAALRFEQTVVPEAHGKLNPPLARANITGAEPPGTERAYHIVASGAVDPPEFDAYLLTLDGREMLCLPLLNDQRHQAGKFGFVGEAFTLQQLALLERTEGTLTLRFPRRILAWMPWPSFPSNVHEAEEGLYRPTARREGITNSFTHFLDLYRAHMDEPEFWGEQIVLRRGAPPRSPRSRR
jgi:hypothetical protein